MEALSRLLVHRQGYDQPIADKAVGSSAPGASLQRRAPPCLVKGLLLFFTLAFVVFAFGLPLWSLFFNDVLGFVRTLCTTPARDIKCGSGAPYVEIAELLGRRDANGTLVGCACEEGILRDWACAAGAPQFSISYFISTPPGTGAMAALSFWPILGQWYFGAGTLRPHGNLVIGSLIAFQLFYGLFLINTSCIFPAIHGRVVEAFIVAEIVHFGAIGVSVGTRTFAGKLISAALAFGVVSILVGRAFPVGPSFLGQHAFWLGECFGISAAFTVAPVLLLFERGDADDDGGAAAAQGA